MTSDNITTRDLECGSKCHIEGRDGTWVKTMLKGYAERHQRGITGLAPMVNIFVCWDTGQALAFADDTRVTPLPDASPLLAPRPLEPQARSIPR